MSGAKASHFDDEPLGSPYSRIASRPKTMQIIHCSMRLGHPIDVDALKKAFSDSVMVKHPRFCSLLVRKHGREYWRKIDHDNIDDHFIIVHPGTATDTASGHVEDDVEAAVNAYVADMVVSKPLSDNKPLWEVHVLLGLNWLVLRVHHSICDIASLMSMLSACFGKQKDGVKERENGERKKNISKGTKTWRKGGVLGWVKSIWFTLVFVGKDIGRGLSFTKERRSVIYGGDGAELLPRKLDTLKFELQDFKSIKNAIPNATINDVFLGIISLGLSKYLHKKSPDAIQHGLQLTSFMPVNLRNGPGLQELEDLMRPNSWWCGSSLWGNKVGAVLQPIECCYGLPPLEYIRRMKVIMDQKKQSYEAHIYYIFPQVMLCCCGSKLVSTIIHDLSCKTTLIISNIAGPSEELTIAGNPVNYMRVHISSSTHALLVYMSTYAGKIDLVVMVAKEIIPDSEFLTECFQESFLEMKSCISGDNK